MPLEMSGSMPQRVAALVAAAIVAVAAATAGAAEAPGQYGGHGVSFSYPTSWQRIDAEFEVQVGSALWREIFAPVLAPTDPGALPEMPSGAEQYSDLIAVAAYRLPVTITKKNLPRYRHAIQSTVMQLAQQANGQLLTGPTRVTMGGMPGYQFEITMPAGGTSLDSRLVLVFKKKTEYFVNCQHLRDGALMAELTAGCDQLTQSFRLSPPSR
jgi:hypothetical protein